MCIRDRPWRVEEYDRIRTCEPQVERLVIVAVGNPRLAREQPGLHITCLLYTSDAADERSSVDLGGRRIIKKKNNKNTE